jgi:signal transduction histidine kinase
MASPAVQFGSERINTNMDTAFLIHEIRNVLSNMAYSPMLIQMNAAELQQKAGITPQSPGGKELQSILGDVEKIDRNLKAMKDLLEGVTLKPADTDVNQLLDGVVTEYQTQYPGIHFNVKKSPLGANLFCDENKVHRIAMNIIKNAAEAIDMAGEQGKTITCSFDKSEDGRYVTLNIHNDGPLIPSDDISKLFAGGYSSKGQRGNGIGLPLCRMMMKAHGGDIEVASSVEKGTTFSLKFPVDGAQSASEASSAGLNYVI